MKRTTSAKQVLGFFTITLVSCAAFGQSLTQDAKNVRIAAQLEQQRVAAETITPLTWEESPPLPPPPKLPIIVVENVNVDVMDQAASYLTGAKSLAMQTAPEQSFSMMMPEYDVLTTQCGDDEHALVGVPPLSQWFTLTDLANKKYPWSEQSDDLWTTNNGPGEISYWGGSMQANSMSVIYTVVTNDFDNDPPYYDPLSHALTVVYKFDPYTNNTGNTLKLSVTTGAAGSDGFFYTNLPPASEWTRISCVVPPFPASAGNPLVCLTVHKGTGNPFNHGPTAKLDPSVQWCPIVLPAQTMSDLWITRSDDTVTASWNNQVYRADYYSLEFAESLEGPWSTDLGTDVIVDGTTSYAVFDGVSGNDARYYRLKHN